METTLGKFCPVCKFKNELSASVCSYCGASLEPLHKGESTTTHVDEETRILVTGPEAEITKRGISAPKKGIAIYLEDGTMLGTREEKEFFLGRHFEGSHLVLVDLIPFGAVQLGV